MGRRYYCDYCEKSTVNDPNAIKVHNRGLQHQKLKKEHYQRYRDVETVLREESAKIPCKRFHGGTECQFGLNCHFSHYTREEINQMRRYVRRKQVESEAYLNASVETWRLSRRRRNLRDGVFLKKLFLRTFLENENCDINEALSWNRPHINAPEYSLPPSVRKISILDFKEGDFPKWG